VTEMKKISILLIALMVISVGFLSGCTGGNPTSMKVDVYFKATGHGATSTPEHQVITIPKDSSKTITFYVHNTGAYNYARTEISMNVDGIMDIDCPTYFDAYTTNESGYVTDYIRTVPIQVTISTVTSLPEDMQVVYIEYSSEWD